jgi:hypothetical protein
MDGGKIGLQRPPIGRKNDNSQQSRIKTMRFFQSTYPRISTVLKLDHPGFLGWPDFFFDDGGFRPNDGRACPWRFAGSGAGLCGVTSCGHKGGMPRCNRPGLASNAGTRKRQLYTSGIQHKSAAQFPTLQKAGSRDKIMLLVVGFRSGTEVHFH